MPSLLALYTFDRNTLFRSPEESANELYDHIRKIQERKDLDKTSSNKVGAYASYLGVFTKDNGEYVITQLGESYLRQYAKNKEDAWSWILTRSLWKYSIPSGTQNQVNDYAGGLGIRFNLFSLVLNVLTHLATEPGLRRFWYFDEILQFLKIDTNWTIRPEELYLQVRKNSMTSAEVEKKNKTTLLQLEIENGVPRDNLNTIFNKAFSQTGLFEYQGKAGIAIASSLSEVHQRRIRHILDHPQLFNKDSLEGWAEYLARSTDDLPEEVAINSASTSHVMPQAPAGEEIANILTEVSEAFSNANLFVSAKMIKRFVCSVVSKRFLILTGLAGSGKTKLAIAFADWICLNERQVCVIPVGADWTNREPILGYVNALENDKYVLPESGALELIIEASKSENQQKPYFLILDEMNMSHVERYFADFLSTMESDKPILLHPDLSAWRDEIPASITLPRNLFVIGTVNIDETTYMFSPKVLDRANVIEFKVSEDDMSSYLSSSLGGINMKSLRGNGAKMGRGFVELSDDRNWRLASSNEVREILLVFFRSLKSVGAEFGYRTVIEILRFAEAMKKLDSSSQLDEIMDAAIVQKLLPKVHGSQRKLEDVLKTLASLCLADSTMTDNRDLSWPIEDGNIRYPLSLDKIQRMYKGLIANGFTSYAEA